MNQVVVFYNPFLPELKISVNGKKLSPYSSLMSFQHQRLEKWSDCLFTELYREVNSDYEMLCVSNHTACRFAETPRFFRSILAGQRCAAASRSAFSNGKAF